MFDWIVSHTPAWNGWIALLLYWMPLVLCLYGYMLKSVSMYRIDLADREHADAKDPPGYYSPTLTIGHLVGLLALALCPIANLFAAVFDVAPKVFADFFAWLGKVLDVPLVPKRKEPRA